VSRPDPPESLTALLGGRRAALDATSPAVAFVAVWLVSGRSLGWGAGAALVIGAAVAALRWRRGDRPLAALLGLLGVSVAALIALYTGRAADFFLAQLLSNVVSALVWAVSVLVRWPLLGVIVGGALGQRTSWRQDPALLRAYSLASWVWVGQYLIRIAVLTPLWLAGSVVALGVARVALSWPLVAACVAVSGAVLVRVLPANHPGLRSVRRS
jgi:xanthosine utilization system XapX-like protein